MNKQSPRFPKKQKIIIAVVGVLVVLASWWAYVSFMPHPLGDRLEYLGKEDLGGGLFFYDSKPYSVYYYGTDLTQEEIKSYFRDATMEHAEKESSDKLLLRFNSSTGHKDFYISYHFNPSGQAFKTTKRSVISIPSFHYETAKLSL